MPTVLLAKPWLLPVLLAALVGAMTLDGGFVMDDRHALLQSPVVQGTVPAWEAWSRSFWGEPLDKAGDAVSWRPLLPLLWRGLWQLGGGAPWPFRLLSLLLHVAATAGVVQVLLAMLERSKRASLVANQREVAVLAGCLFAVHATHAEVVGAIVSHADLAATLLGCLGLAGVVRATGGSGSGSGAGGHSDPAPVGPGTEVPGYHDAVRLRGRPAASGGSTRAILLASLWFLPAVLAKESALLYAAVGMVWLAATRSAGLAVLAAGVAPTAIWTVAMQAKAFAGRTEGAVDNVLVALGGLERAVTGLAIVSRAALMSLLPVGLAPSHGYAVYTSDVGDLWPAAGVGAVLLAATVVAGMWAIWRQRPLFAAGLAMWGGTLLAGSHLLFVGPTELAERLLYPATIVTCMGMAALLWLRPWPLAQRQLVAAVTVLGLLAATWEAQRPWAQPLTLWQRAVEVEPKSWRHQHNLGDALAKSGQTTAGLWHVLVGVWLRRNLPKPVDFRLVEALELLPLAERMARAPQVLDPVDPCGLIGQFAAKAYPTSPANQAAAARILTQQTPCPPL
jgi:hypothetical protein